MKGRFLDKLANYYIDDLNRGVQNKDRPYTSRTYEIMKSLILISFFSKLLINI